MRHMIVGWNDRIHCRSGVLVSGSRCARWVICIQALFNSCWSNSRSQLVKVTPKEWLWKEKICNRCNLKRFHHLWRFAPSVMLAPKSNFLFDYFTDRWGYLLFVHVHFRELRLPLHRVCYLLLSWLNSQSLLGDILKYFIECFIWFIRGTLFISDLYPFL